jgi:replicative DNA helicase
MEFPNLIDPAAERAALAALCEFGGDFYLEVGDVLSASSFEVVENQPIFACVEKILKESPSLGGVDYSAIMSAASSLGLSDVLLTPVQQRQLRGVLTTTKMVRRDTASRLVKKVKKLELMRGLALKVEEGREAIARMTGDEPIDKMIAEVEEPLFDFTSRLASADKEGTVLLGEGAEDFYADLFDNPREQIGIPSGFPRWDRAIGGGFRRGCHDVIAAFSKVGKAQPLDAIVQTPAGPRSMGDIRVGDAVCTPTGMSRVAQIHPQGVVDIYRVTFADGDSVECCDEHLWEVEASHKRKPEILPLKTIRKKVMRQLHGRNNSPKWGVRLPVACHYESRDVPIPPYLLGCLIGDGGLTTGVGFTTADPEMVGYLEYVVGHDTPDHIFRRIPSAKYGYRLARLNRSEENHYTRELVGLGLFGYKSTDKFIPDLYKYNSVRARTQLLQGLMDTDGSVMKNGSIEFSTSSKRLACDMKELVESLGGLCSTKGGWTECEGKKFWSYRCRLRFDDPRPFFRLPRKLARCKVRKKRPLKRKIVSVEYVGKKEAQCITLADPRGLYLTNNCVVTHNSFLSATIALHLATIDIPVLVLDTEMSKDEYLIRVGAAMTGVPIWDIERGTRIRGNREKLLGAGRSILSRPFSYRSIAGEPFTETMAAARRWVARSVGYGEDGLTRPCLVVFDYMKVMDPALFSKAGLAEYQAIGFMADALKQFANLHKASVLSFVQLNREGLVSQSDRIKWFCTSLSMYHWKSEEEAAEEDGESAKYTHKLCVDMCRHGEGLDDGDFINISSDYRVGRIEEGPTRNELARRGASSPNKGFVTEGPLDEDF